MNYSVPPAQLLSGGTRRPQAGCLQWMQDVVCQLVGICMVQQYVMNGKRAVGTVRHDVLPGERFHVNTIIYQVQGLLPSDIFGPCALDRPAVHLQVKPWAENVAL